MSAPWPPKPAGTEPLLRATGAAEADEREAERAQAPTYESASARLDAIVRRLDSGEAGLRETLELCQEGRTLVEFCAAELEAVGRGLEELRLDELVARLEEGARRPAPAPPEQLPE